MNNPKFRIGPVKLPKGEVGRIVGTEVGGQQGNERLKDGWNYYVQIGESTQATVFSEQELEECK